MPFVLYMLCLILRTELAGHLEASVLQWLYPLQIALVATALWHFREEYRELGVAWSSDWRGGAVKLALFVLVGMAVFVAWINLEVPVLSLGSSPAVPPPLHEGVPDWRWIVLRIMGAALIVPVMEELFWRSLIMRWLEARDFIKQSAATVSWRSVWISSLVFGLEHNLWFAGALAGVVYACLYRRFGLGSAIISHGMTNFLLGLWVLHTGQWQFW